MSPTGFITPELANLVRLHDERRDCLEMASETVGDRTRASWPCLAAFEDATVWSGWYGEELYADLDDVVNLVAASYTATAAICLVDL